MRRKPCCDQIDQILDQSTDAMEIMNSITKRLNIPTHSKQQKTYLHQKYHETKEVQTELSNDQMATEFIPNWIFGESPDLHEIPPDLEIEPSHDFSLPEDIKKNRGVDDGSFLQDPILKELRRRLLTLEKSALSFITK